MTNHDYECSDHFEVADSALRGALALSAVISDASPGGERPNHWSPRMMDDLEMARRTLINAARDSLDALRKERWQARALLGHHGPEARARAEAEVAAHGGREAHA